MTISTLPTAPARTDPPATFITRADAFVAALPTLVTEMNTDLAIVNALAGGLPARAAYTFSATTTATPAAGTLRFNSATQTGATELYISETMAASVDANGFLNQIESSTSTSTKCIIKVSETGTPTDYIYFRVTSLKANNAADREYNVLCIGASATGSNVPIGATTVYVDIWPMADAGSVAGGVAMTDANITGIKLAGFTAEYANTTPTTGAATLNWNNGAMQSWAEPTGAITFTFTAPTAISAAHLQLRIISDGSSSAFTHVWPAAVKWYGTTWSAVANKGAIINFFWNGTIYVATGANAV